MSYPFHKMHKCTLLVLCGAFVYLSGQSIFISSANTNQKNSAPTESKSKVIAAQGIYHGAFPDFGETEDVVTDEAISDFENATGKPIAWAYFSNNWFVEKDDGRIAPEIKFPRRAVEVIWNHRKDHRVIPFIRMMARSRWKENAPDPVYTMQRIISGEFDSSLRAWADEARERQIPLMIEFGTEVNNDYFPWNGAHNGGAKTDGYGDPQLPDGAERFRDSYRHIINLFRLEKANNITWVYHVDVHPSPKRKWNNIAAYYPGDEYIDWLGLSVYGPQTRRDEYESFKAALNSSHIYDELTKLSSKPIAILEFGIRDHERKTEWIDEALRVVKDKYPRIKAISYWQSKWKNEDGSISDLRLKGDSLKIYRDKISDPIFLSEASLGN